MTRFLKSFSGKAQTRRRILVAYAVLTAAMAAEIPAQQTNTVPNSAQFPASSDANPQPAASDQTQPVAQPAPKPVTTPAPSPEPDQAGNVTEDELRGLLVGKELFLRGGYLDNSLSFDEHGRLIGRSPQGSYTLSAIRIEKVRLKKHKVELEGARYGLHFLGQLAYGDSGGAVDRVKITPKKKVVRITIDREMVVTPKKKKEKKENKKPAAAAGAQPGELSEAEQLKASIAATPQGERPADEKSVTTTTSPAHAAKMLNDALDAIFAPGLDERMMAAMPDFWKRYYQAAAAKTDYRPSDPGILRQNMVDKKARLLTRFEPPSNEWAQANAVSGMALYHTVIGADGKPGEIAVARPIGFGLDENAVESIRKASFEPAIKDGKPVPVVLDLVVQFRIYSNRTNVVEDRPAAAKPSQPALPGPYSVGQPQPQPQ